MKNRTYQTISVFGLCAFVLGLACFGGGGKGTAWKKFGTGGIEYATPAGWTRVDPFTTGTPSWSHQWYHASPPYDTRMAFLQSPVREPFQLFLILGDKDTMERILEQHIGDYNTHPLVDGVTEWVRKTSGGVDVRGYIARMRPGALAGDDVTYVLGFAYVDDKIFVLNGGGKTEYFDFDIVSEVIESLKLG